MKDEVTVENAVNKALGPERIELALDDTLQELSSHLKNRIAAEVALSRFAKSPEGKNVLIVVVPRGTYHVAKRKIRRILTEIYKNMVVDSQRL